MQRHLASVHLWVGVLAAIAFLLTGQYMDKVHAHLVGMPDAPRMLYRSTHLYILYSGLANLALGLHRAPYPGRFARRLQTAGSLLFLALPLVFTVAFFIEPGLTELARPLTRPATYMAFGGGILLLAAHTLNNRRGASLEPLA